MRFSPRLALGALLLAGIAVAAPAIWEHVQYFYDAAHFKKTLAVDGATTLSGTLSTAGATTLASTLGVTGATTLSSTLGVSGTATLNARHVEAAQALSIADDPADGGTVAAEATLTPTKGYVECTCSDTDGCNVTMSETGAVEGQMLTVVNVGSNDCVFADSAGVSELSGTITLGANDSLVLRYTGATWVQVATTNN